MVVRQPGFLCCLRGTSADGLPIIDAGPTLLTVPDTPWINLVIPVKRILTEYLTTNNATGDTMEDIIDYTFKTSDSIVKPFIHELERRIFEPHKGLPTYEWNEEAKKKYLQVASKFKR